MLVATYWTLFCRIMKWYKINIFISILTVRFVNSPNHLMHSLSGLALLFSHPEHCKHRTLHSLAKQRNVIIWEFCTVTFAYVSNICHLCRGRNKVGPQINCPQNLVRAHKMFRPRAQMAHENVGSFQNLMYRRYQKKKTNKQTNKSGPE